MVAGHLNAKYMEIRKEWKLLDALLEDHAEVLRSADQIKQNAEKLFDSELIHAGWTVQLNAMQQWINDAKKLVEKIKSFRGLKNKRKSPMWLVSFFIYLPEMYFVLDLVKFHNKALQKKPYADIYASLEQSKVQGYEPAGQIINCCRTQTTTCWLKFR
ncbi:putative inactive disease susceptibility protein LOV1 [Prunus yedoensis var. nudiflora]|uniref:Putative inactive disease susceptibility protein LOV1 n=1 Tax=Prunus yedoensis var. nudiflora TaxID=2094558 RepID=A0A314XWU0_PRUYE|nr:putative inactive disease susceptibility protein LOV1 [Prunus yedoensis var. nudiflora]